MELVEKFPSSKFSVLGFTQSGSWVEICSFYITDMSKKDQIIEVFLQPLGEDGIVKLGDTLVRTEDFSLFKVQNYGPDANSLSNYTH